MTKQCIWPAPVYVAKFSDGTECRMSFWSTAGKAFDFERGRKLCAQAIGNERARAGCLAGDGPARLVGRLFLSAHWDRARDGIPFADGWYHRNTRPGDRAMWMSGRKLIGMGGSLTDRGLACWRGARLEIPHGCAAATDLVDGWVEHNGDMFPDPMFYAEVAPEPKKRARNVVSLADHKAALAALAQLADTFGDAFPDELAAARALLAKVA